MQLLILETKKMTVCVSKMMRVLRRTLEQKTEPMPNARANELPGVVFEVTPSCNLNCRYCYNVHKIPGAANPSKYSYSQAVQTLKKLFRTVEVKHITMSGGEPLMAQRFNELVLFCRMKGKAVTVISNGTVAVREHYQQLIDLGVNAIELPLHSSHPEKHDEMTRHKGSWEKARRSIEVVRDLGGQAVPVIVITKINWEGVGDTLRLLKDMGCRRIMLNRFNLGGNGIEQRSRLELTIDELRLTFEIANSVAEKSDLTLTSNVCTPLCAIDPSQYPHIAFSQCSLDLKRRPLTLDVIGNVRFCNHSPKIMGNVFRDDLIEMLDSDYARSWQRTIPIFCHKCALWHKCLGGCRAASEQLGQSLQWVDPLLQ